MIFLVQFGKNKHLLVFKKFTRAYLFQIALEIMWLPIQTKYPTLTFQLNIFEDIDEIEIPVFGY